jgi:hypothetical protein
MKKRKYTKTKRGKPAEQEAALNSVISFKQSHRYL